MKARPPFQLPLPAALLAALLVGAPPVAAQMHHDHGHGTDDPAAVITAETIYDRLYFIASDALMGRDTPSPGLEAAAAYLVSEHRRMGLEPGADGSYYQRWPYRLVGPDLDAASLRLNDRELRPGRDAALRGGAEDVTGDLVLVDGQLGQPEEGSLAGRVAVFALPLDGGWNNQARQRSLQQARWAEASGARAAVHLVGPAPGGLIEAMAEQLAQPSRVMGAQPPFPQVYVDREAAVAAVPELETLLAGSGSSATLRPVEGRLTGSMPALHHDDAHPANVVAVIRGSDPELRDEYVVLSAHYDHVGVGTPMNGDSIYNGADDNGSGTVVLLETARAISAMGEAPRRSVAFVHVSGEERGLLGSRWFVENPPAEIPVERMVANINADMVAGDSHRDTLVVIGKEYSTLGPLVDEINDSMPDLGLVTSDDLWPEQRFFYRSDQLNFMRMEIPSLFFFTGVHECYHRPCDTVDFVDPDKAARVARLLVHSVLAIANADERPEWDPAGLAEVRELTGGR
jgi:hypothetical protein